MTTGHETLDARSTARPAADPGTTAPARPALALVLLLSAYILITLTLYAGRMPWIHEEPRRAIVAQEMLLSGDPVVATIYRAPYFRKPPLYNWLLALGSAGDRVVTPGRARGVSTGALLLLGASVYALLRRRAPAVALLGFAVVTTNYLLLCEYGNLAEPDLVLGLLTFLAFAVYIVSPLRLGNVALSSLFMGLGILAKGVSPIFFYPAMIAIAATEREHRGRRFAFLGLHGALSLILPGLWLFALHRLGLAGQFLTTGGAELAGKTIGAFWDYPKHIAAYPLRMFVVLLPWTAILVAAWRRGRVTAPLYRSSLLVCGISLVLFTLAAGSRDRYLIPAIPCFAIVGAYRIDGERRVAPRVVRILLVALAVAIAAWGVFLLTRHIWLQAALLLLLAATTAVLAPRPFRVREFGLALALIVFTFYEHGLYHFQTTYRVPSYPTAQTIARTMTQPWPVLVESRLDLIHVAVDLEGIRQRPVYDRHGFEFSPAYLLTDPQHLDPRGREILRLPYARRNIRELVLQQIGPEAGTGEARTSFDTHEAVPDPGAAMSGDRLPEASREGE